MVRPLTFYREYIRPSTLYYKLIQQMYRKGKRPKPWSPFYSEVLADEARRMHGR